MCNCNKRRRPVVQPETITPPSRPSPDAQTAGAQPPSGPWPSTPSE